MKREDFNKGWKFKQGSQKLKWDLPDAMIHEQRDPESEVAGPSDSYRRYIFMKTFCTKNG